MGLGYIWHVDNNHIIEDPDVKAIKPELKNFLGFYSDEDS